MFGVDKSFLVPIQEHSSASGLQFPMRNLLSLNCFSPRRGVISLSGFQNFPSVVDFRELDDAIVSGSGFLGADWFGIR